MRAGKAAAAAAAGGGALLPEEALFFAPLPLPLPEPFLSLSTTKFVKDCTPKDLTLVLRDLGRTRMRADRESQGTSSRAWFEKHTSMSSARAKGGREAVAVTEGAAGA